jgi:hypothetical protein
VRARTAGLHAMLLFEENDTSNVEYTHQMVNGLAG